MLPARRFRCQAREQGAGLDAQRLSERSDTTELRGIFETDDSEAGRGRRPGNGGSAVPRAWGWPGC
jgi:hypothetical protein